MTSIPIRQAKAELEALIDRAQAGEDIVIMGDSIKACRLVPVDEPARKVRIGYGSLAHLAPIPDSIFFDPLPEEELEAWEGKFSFPQDDRK